MKRFLQSIVCLIAALHLVGGHWGVLQMVAWARMLNEYTEQRGLITGVMETFDGQHGCAMCKKIADGRQKEQKENLPLTKSGQENLAKWFGDSRGVAIYWLQRLWLLPRWWAICFQGHSARPTW